MTAAVGYKSTQYLNSTADPVVPVSAAANGPQGLKVRYFETPALAVAGIAANADYFDVCVIPKGARLLGGFVTTDDANAKVGVGTSAGATTYGSALAIGGDAPKAFGNTIALGFGAVLTASIVLRLTLNTADLDIGKLIKGYVTTLETVP